MSKKDQYHHFIPRFILREFQSGTKKSKQERQEEFKKTGVVNERVYFYNVKNRTLENRLIGTVYGVTNLYRDVTNVEQVDEVEEKFSKLESHCAKLIQDLHKRLDGSITNQRTYPIMRKDLDQLRKFLFLMHFRNAGLRDSYFDPEHPDHRGVRDVLEKRWAQAPGAKSAKDVWLHAVKYYLDTSHSQMLLQFSEKAPTTADPVALAAAFNSHSLENATRMDVITYQQQAGMYYLSIVRAAPGLEFVLGNNSFGLWEGVLGPGAHGIHRIYVVSPRIALILRFNGYSSDFRTPELLKATDSDLISIELPKPTCTFAFTGSEDTIRSMAEYRASPKAERDLFTFPITKLSAAQTSLINNVVLHHIPLLTGSLTFKDPLCMRVTLRQYWRLRDIPMNRFTRLKYLPLIQIIGLPIRGQPDDFNVPLDRVFVPTITGGETVITTLAAMKKSAARRKRKGKGKEEASAPIPESAQTPAESPADRLYTLSMKRVCGNLPDTRERYTDSFEAWGLMHHDDPSENTHSHPLKGLFHLSAMRFKEHAEPFLHVPRPPGFAAAPNSHLKPSAVIASDATIRAIFDGGGKWFDKSEDKFGLHIADETQIADSFGMRNITHLLRDLLILEVVTWLARNRHDILQKIVIPNLDLSLYLTTAADAAIATSTVGHTGTPSSASHSSVSEAIHTTTTPTNDPAPSRGLTPVDETNSTESLSTVSPKKKKNKKKNQTKKPAVGVVVNPDHEASKPNVDPIVNRKGSEEPSGGNAQSESTPNVHQTIPETPSTSTRTASASVKSKKTPAELVMELCLAYGNPDRAPTDARTRYKNAVAIRNVCLSPHASEIMRDDHLGLMQNFLQLSEEASRRWFSLLKPADRGLGAISPCRMKDSRDLDGVSLGSISFFFMLSKRFLDEMGVRLGNSDIQSRRSAFPHWDENRWRFFVRCSQGVDTLLCDMLSIDLFSRISVLRPDTLPTLFRSTERSGVSISELFV